MQGRGNARRREQQNHDRHHREQHREPSVSGDPPRKQAGERHGVADENRWIDRRDVPHDGVHRAGVR